MDANLIYLGWVIGLAVAGFVGLQSLARAYRGVSAFLNLDEAGWWRTTMPWPQGVQEDDEVHFHMEAEPAATEPAGPTVEDVASAGPDVHLQRPDGHVRIR